MNEEGSKKSLRKAYWVSFASALLFGGVFLVITTFNSDYGAVSRYGGAIWVFTLTLIIALPTVAPIIKRRSRISH